MHVTDAMRAGEVSYQTTTHARFLSLAGVLCILIGYWAPWIAHPAAGLVQNGFDLSEFIKFLPQVKDNSEPLIRWLFFLPLTTMALSMGLAIYGLLPQTSSWLRMALGGLALLLLIILIPPYPYTSERLLGGEFRARTIMTVVSWVAFPLTVIWPSRWPSTRGISLLLALLTVAGVVGPIVQYLSLRDVLSIAYGEPVTIGWGVWLMVASMLVVLGDTLAANRRQA